MAMPYRSPSGSRTPACGPRALTTTASSANLFFLTKRCGNRRRQTTRFTRSSIAPTTSLPRSRTGIAQRLNALPPEREPDSSARGEESPDDLGWILMARVHGIVHRLHVVGGNVSGQRFERAADSGIPQQRGGARHRRRVVRREIVAVV